jgi:hypothetical protein
MSLFYYFKNLLKTFSSNISPNNSYLKDLIFNANTNFRNIKFSIKNCFNKPGEFKNINIYSRYWNNAIVHLRFALNYYEPIDLVNSPIIRATACGFGKKNNDLREEEMVKKKFLYKITKEICKKFKKIDFSSLFNWLDVYFGSLDSGVIGKDLSSKIKELSVLEIGAGLGMNAYLWPYYTKNTYHIYDLYEMNCLQKKIHSIFANNLKTNKINYTSDIEILKNKLKNKYFIVSYWAFSEFPMQTRKLFEDIIEKSKFSIFLANENFENVSNHAYFKNLSTNLNRYLKIVPYIHRNQPEFTKKHKFFIIY